MMRSIGFDEHYYLLLCVLDRKELNGGGRGIRQNQNTIFINTDDRLGQNSV